ncbi:MAG: class I SAM-dependent methyltransferase [Turicibacter sp.]
MSGYQVKKYDFKFNIDAESSQAYIAKEIQPGSEVLEFGTANGVLTKYLVEQNGCKVFGIEYNEGDAELASKFTEKMHVGDIEKYEWLALWRNKKFDYIIFADILEHLHDPRQVLLTASTLLKFNGKILISIPNIAHNSIIMQLINDRFDYHSTGLLDRTHIRFFTKKTLDELISSVDLHISSIRGIYRYPEETEFSERYNHFNSCLAECLRYRKYGEIYQFIYTIQNKSVELRDFTRKVNKAVLYFDSGAGFDEKDTLSIDYDDNELVFYFSFEESKYINSLRFDPSLRPMKVKIKSIYVDGVFFDSYTHNGFGSEVIYFLSNDPYIIIPSINDNVKTVQVTFEYLSFEVNVEKEKIELEYNALLNGLDGNLLENKVLPNENSAEVLKNSMAVIYYDLGSGFTEDNSIYVSLDEESLNFEYDLSDVGVIKSLRFDPVQFESVCNIDSIKINGTLIDRYESNGFDCNDCLVFTNKDPMIIFSDINETVHCFQINFNFIKEIKNIGLNK